MNRSGETTVSDTPFARVLTRYMWSKQPPWSAAKTAAVLGIHRTRVANWVYHGILPELDTMLVVMARLGIPMRDLLDAYAAAGIPVPAMERPAEPEQPTPPTPVAPAPSADADFYAVPNSRRSGGRVARATTRAGGSQSGKPTPATSEAAEPAEEHATASAGEQVKETASEWETMVAHTREVMSLSGMSQAMIDAMINGIQKERTGETPGAEERRRQLVSEEHADPTSSPSTPATPATTTGKPERQRAKSPREVEQTSEENVQSSVSRDN